MSTVYIVHAIDAEGPLVEDLGATFERLNYIFDVSIEESLENLISLQNGDIDLGDKTRPIQSLLAAQNLSYLGDWGSIDAMLDKILTHEYRNILPDSDGASWIYNWFCLDHVGFEDNPRLRDLGHHKVFDHYRSLLTHEKNQRDAVYFHYHPLPYNKKAHSCATFYLNSNHLFEIIARKIIERQWFPTVFRAGFHTLRPDSHWFLEQWMPYDFSNQATDAVDDHPDLADGRFGDWRRAPSNWLGYHPSHNDYQSSGQCRRWLFRSLNMQGRLRVITQNDVDQAFMEAHEHGSSILAFTNHDFRHLAPDIARLRNMIKIASQKWAHVRFKYSTAKQAARSHTKFSNTSPLGLKIAVAHKSSSLARLTAKTVQGIFGPQPFLAIRDKQGNYYFDNFDFDITPHSWHYSLDWQTFSLDSLDCIAVAAPTEGADAEIGIYDVVSGRTSYYIVS